MTDLDIVLNKEDVIEKLIDMSIELFFTLKDPISVHVLSSSANVMLTDISMKEEIDMFFGNRQVKVVRLGESC